MTLSRESKFVLIFGILRGNPEVFLIFGVVLIFGPVLIFGVGVYSTETSRMCCCARGPCITAQVGVPTPK